jgi:hypothetical protein
MHTHDIVVSLNLNFCFFILIMELLDLPIEILTLIATEDLETFSAAILTPGIGPRLCCEYTQRYAKNKFTTVVKDGVAIKYYIGGKLHREDGPAVIGPQGWVKYYINGKLHRDDGPAVIWTSGSVEYYNKGKRHREDGPAVIYASGEKIYYLDDKLYREDDYLYKKIQN